MSPITFVVPGIPQPQGSARAFTYRRSAEKGGGFGARVDSDNPKLKGWRRDVARIAQRVYRGPALDGPMQVCVQFYLPPPKSLKRPKPHITRPDVDKCARGILDALTGVIFRDDEQVTCLDASKHYAACPMEARAVITVTPLESVDGDLFHERKAG